MKRDKKKSEYTFFDSESIAFQFQEIRTKIGKELEPSEIIVRINEILVNRAIPSYKYSHTNKLNFYRITKGDFESFNEDIKDSYSYPRTNSRANRANLQCYPVMYTALDFLTALMEMKGTIKEGERFYLSRWKSNFTKEILAHHLLINTTTISNGNVVGQIAKDQLSKLNSLFPFENVPLEFKLGFQKSVEELGNLFTHPSEEYYHITSAYAHDILYESRKKELKFEILIYPSVASGLNSLNAAIHPNLIESNELVLNEVYELSILENDLKSFKDGSVKLTIHKRGVFEDGKIKYWAVPNARVEKLVFNELKVLTYNGYEYRGEEAAEMNIMKSHFTVQDLLNYILKSDKLTPFLFEIMSEKNENDFGFNKLEYIHFYAELNHGNKILTEKGPSCIKKLELPIFIMLDYQPI